MRIRTAVLCSLAVGAIWFCSDAASALEVGPVSVPLPLPPAVTVTLPPTQVAPGAGASVNVSPQTGVDATVSLPSSIGPVPVLPGAPHDVQIGLGAGGATVTAPSGSVSAPGVPGGVPQVQSPRPSGEAALGAGTGSASRTGARRALPTSGATNAAPLPWRASLPPSVRVEPQPGAVNASLQHESPGGVWSFFHDLASAHGLWIALLLIVAIARFAAGGLLHDALRRRAGLSST